MIIQQDASKRGKASRNKGARAERELANHLKDEYGLKVRRGQVFNHEPDLVGLVGIHPEVKRQDRLNIHEAMAQAIGAAQKHGGLPAVFFRRDRGEWMVCMRLIDWMKLYRVWRVARRAGRKKNNER